ncbi:MAG: ABC transporter permease subunit [Candidatus Pacebacteria bacterium]|nr:ABC transporter permease subunit [Candidatus Paceibacterota bacterium]
MKQTRQIETAPGFAIVLAGRRIPGHRLILAVIFAVILAMIVTGLDWGWLGRWWPEIIRGVVISLLMLLGSVVLGFALAVPLGLMQLSPNIVLNGAARGFCTLIRGTPLLLQLWLIYFGLGSLFPHFPWIQESIFFPILREGWPFGLLALTLSFAAYEGEVMRGSFASVPRGELQAGKAIGLSGWQLLRRIWFPRAFYQALPTLVGETVLQLKSTPLVATVTVIDIYAVLYQVRQETLLTYEPLLLLAAVYIILTGILVLLGRQIEMRIPGRRPSPSASSS